MAEGKRLPYSYKSFLSSEMFTLRAGSSLKPFYVHRQLLGEISSELRGHVFNEMKEGLEESMDMAHVSEETMCQFLEFCYTGDYSILECEDEDISSLQCLLPNAKLYVFGDMYNIPRVKDVALARIKSAIITFGYPHGDEADTHVQLLKYAFENLPERKETDPLLLFLGKFVAWALKSFRGNESFLNLLAGNGRVDLIKLVLDSVEELEDEIWWHAAQVES